ncbi:nuclear transport factor 2 family protein [candidate division KSB1 bacterium]|nr:nuclear transport factor 2 family protein [candidate division KSB1 bacterium]
MTPTRMSRLESAVRIVLEYYKAFNLHDIAGMMRLMSEDCVFEYSKPAPDGAKYSGKETVTKFWQDFFRESPHGQVKIEDVFGMGFRCVVRWQYHWMDADGKNSYVRGVDIFQVKGGTICEKLSYMKG